MIFVAAEMLYDVACSQPVLQPLVDVVVPSAGVRVLGRVGGLLDLCEYNEVVFGRIEPALSTLCQRQQIERFLISLQAAPTRRCSYMGQGDRSVPSVLRPCSGLGTKQP